MSRLMEVKKNLNICYLTEYSKPRLIFLCIFNIKLRGLKLKTFYWWLWVVAVIIKLYSRVFPKSVHFFGMLLFLQLICMVCGHEGPGVELKVISVL